MVGDLEGSNFLLLQVDNAAVNILDPDILCTFLFPSEESLEVESLDVKIGAFQSLLTSPLYFPCDYLPFV